MTARSRTFVATVVAVLITVAPAEAQVVKTWTGGVSTGWNNANNWAPLGIPLATDIALFNNVSLTTASVITSNSSIAALQFDRGALNFSLTSNAGISLSGLNAITVSATTTGVQTINLANIATGSLLFPTGQNLTITNNMSVFSPGLLVIGPNTVIGTPGTGGVIFTGTGVTAFSGAFSSTGPPDNQVVGGITKSGPGELVLAGSLANVNGGFTFNGGLLQLDYSANTASKLPSLGTLNLMGGELELVPNATNTVTQAAVGGTVFSAGHTDIRALGAGAALALDLGPVTRSAQGTFNVPATGMLVRTNTTNTNGLFGAGPAFATFGGTNWARQTGSNLVAVAGTADIYSSGTNTDINVSQGAASGTTNSIRFNNSSLNLGIIGTLTLQSGGILVPTGITGSTITGSSFDLLTTPGGTGEILVHAYGPLTITSRLASSAGLTKTGPAELTLGVPPASANVVTGPITIHRGRLRVIDKFAVNSASAINFTDNAARGSGAQTLTFELGDNKFTVITQPIRFSAAADGPDVFPNVITTGSNNNSRVELTGVISSAPSTVTPLRFDGEGGDTSGFNLRGTNTFTGTVRVSNGTLGINSNASLGDPANRLELATDNVTAGGLEFLNTGIDLARPVEMMNAGRIISNGADVNTISGPISGLGRLYKAGTGTLVLTGNNTSTGSFQIDAGTLRVDASGLGTSGAPIVGSGGTLSVMENASLSPSFFFFVGPQSGMGAGTIEVLSGVTFTVDSVVTKFGAAVGGLIKTGPGTLVLNSPVNLYNGGTTVRAGMLNALADASLGAASAPVTIEPLGTLRFNASTTTARTFSLFNGTIETLPGANLTINGATVGGGFLRGVGAYNLTGGTTLTGVTTFNSTTMNITGAATVANFANNGTITVSSGQVFGMNFATNGAAALLTINGIANVNDLTSYGRMQINPGGTLQNTQGSLVFGGGSVTNIGIYNPANGQVTPGGVLNFGPGPMRVQGGLVRNNGIITGTGDLIIDFGGVVRGAGEIDTPNAPIRINGGQLIAGNSPGLTRVSNFSLVSTGVTGGDFSNATGIAGPPIGSTGTQLSGWSVFEFGNSTNTGGSAQVQGTTASRAIWQFSTVLDSGNYSTPGVPANFNHMQSYIWQIVRPRSAADVNNPNNSTPTNTVAQISIFDTGTMMTVPLTEANLNAYLRFDDSAFNFGGVPVNERGMFAFVFLPDGLGAMNRVIAVTYTPVPEPVMVLAFAAAVVAAHWRRRRSSRQSV